MDIDKWKLVLRCILGQKFLNLISLPQTTWPSSCPCMLLQSFHTCVYLIVGMLNIQRKIIFWPSIHYYRSPSIDNQLFVGSFFDLSFLSFLVLGRMTLKLLQTFSMRKKDTKSSFSSLNGNLLKEVENPLCFYGPVKRKESRDCN